MGDKGERSPSGMSADERRRVQAKQRAQWLASLRKAADKRR